MNVILGGGLAGLAAAYRLSQAGCQAQVIEKNSQVGGLARTVTHGNFKFDLGGHRFLADNFDTMNLVKGLLGEDLLTVPRSSQIYMNGKFVDYPLNPLNAVSGLGLATIARIGYDYGQQKLGRAFARKPLLSLEDWVVANFGRCMFELYFKDYSEKVWGLDCSRISMEWMEKRIDGLSLWKAVKYALFKLRGRDHKTLTDSFYYPRRGIGQLADYLQEAIVSGNSVQTDTEVRHIFHTDNVITGVEIKRSNKISLLRGSRYLSSIPLTMLLAKMSPSPPEHILAAAARIGFRSLVVVTLMLKQKKVTDLTWLYFPGKEIAFGRIHEPTNWSRELAPLGNTHLVVEYFCDRHDEIWQRSDTGLINGATEKLVQLKFIKRRDLIDGCVRRIPYAYPVFGLHYQEHLRTITEWLDKFSTLHLIGRSGSYSYLNMDRAMESGMATADEIIQRGGADLSYDDRLVARPCRI